VLIPSKTPQKAREEVLLAQ